MKKAIIIHCWEGYPEYCWYQYAKRELEAQGFEAIVPEFPDTNLPQLEKWLEKLREIAGEPGEELFLIGHSIGAVTILQYLAGLSQNQRIGGAVLVAGFTDDMGYKEFKNFFDKPLDLNLIKTKANGFVAIHSDNDPYISMEYGEKFKNELGADLIVKHNMKHFSGAAENEGSCVELPDVVDAVVRLAVLSGAGVKQLDSNVF